jgi:two-component system nitrate/nitrite response regulator NarL
MLSARFGRPAEGMGGNAAAGIARGERAPDAPAGKVRVVIGSSVRLYREGLAQALGAEHGVDVVGSAPSPGEILAVVADTRPDVVLLDMAMEADPGFVRGLVHRIPAPVVVLGVEDEDVLAWAESGIAGFVTREGAVSDLVASVASAARGELVCSPQVAFGMLRRLGDLASQPAPAVPSARLTHRELEVLRLIAGGLSNKEIANRLGVALSTVKNHVHNILEKLQVVRRHEAALAVRGPEIQILRPRDLGLGPGAGAPD